jgi:hypothetical protein
MYILSNQPSRWLVERSCAPQCGWVSLRAYAMQGDTAKAKAAYQNFLALWKDADPYIPIVKQAKTEYAKLQ